MSIKDPELIADIQGYLERPHDSEPGELLTRALAEIERLRSLVGVSSDGATFAEIRSQVRNPDAAFRFPVHA